MLIAEKESGLIWLESFTTWLLLSNNANLVQSKHIQSPSSAFSVSACRSRLSNSKHLACLVHGAKMLYHVYNSCNLSLHSVHHCVEWNGKSINCWLITCIMFIVHSLVCALRMHASSFFSTSSPLYDVVFLRALPNALSTSCLHWTCCREQQAEGPSVPCWIFLFLPWGVSYFLPHLACLTFSFCRVPWWLVWKIESSYEKDR